MKTLFRALSFSLLSASALSFAPEAAANLIQNGTFTNITYTGTKPLTTLFGQFGNNSGPATGSTLTVNNWNTSGYNFVYAPGTADSGTGTAANANQPNMAPGQFNNAAGYGSTYLWGANNGGASVLPATDPNGGNFIAADGAYETDAVTQSVSGLTIGNSYRLSFYWAGAQQQGFDGATTDQWQVSLGTVSGTNPAQTTPVVNVAAHSFSGWMLQTFTFTANATTETLSFLAIGTPTGQPPFSLLGGVSLDVVPEFSNWMVFAGFGALCTMIEVNRRRRQPRLASVPVS